ncbi:MAG: hypothetical protein KJ889_06635 [Gammaproteobacteria bacterium]|nr:hypothetical protein [Gammaproteobacteria bacterium]
MDVISSIPSLYNFQREGISGDGLMKRYAILFDRIIFNRHGAPIGDFGIKSLAEVVSMLISTGESLSERRSLGANKRFQNLFVDCWDVVRDAERFESMKYEVIPEETQNRISEFCFSEVRRQNELPANSYAFDIDDVKELSGDLYADIGLNILAKAEGLDIVPNYSPIIGRALENEIALANGQCHELFSGGLLVPEFDCLSWDEILELRQDRSVKSFRKAVYELMGSGVPLDDALQKRIQEDLWRLAGDVRPNVRQSVLAGIGSNLPSPIFVNPIGVGLAFKEIWDARERENQYGHVFFIQNMRQRRS